MKITGDVTVTNSYPITITNGRIVEDEWTAALARAGYAIVPMKLPTEWEPGISDADGVPMMDAKITIEPMDV